jgi:acetoin utilization deacetylase AcuC-like enzyme
MALQIFYSDHFVIPLPAGHRFPMEKYSLLREMVLQERIASPENMHVPHAAKEEEITRAHSRDYLQRVKNGGLTSREIAEIGFPWSPALVERSRRSCGGTIEACRAALSNGFAVNLAGGTHHAFHDHGAGYCIFNDSAVAVCSLQAEGMARRVVIIDCDVHQGNGTARIFADSQEVFTFSTHGAKNYPLHKETSDLDVALPDGTEDYHYLRTLESGIRQALDRAEAELAIYLAGADPYYDDRFGRLKLSKNGLSERDWIVLKLCSEAGLPVAVTMAGGYARKVQDTVDIHLQTVKMVANMAERF